MEPFLINTFSLFPGYYQPAGPLISPHLLPPQPIPQSLEPDQTQSSQSSISTADNVDPDVMITGKRTRNDACHMLCLPSGTTLCARCVSTKNKSLKKGNHAKCRDTSAAKYSLVTSLNNSHSFIFLFVPSPSLLLVSRWRFSTETALQIWATPARLLSTNAPDALSDISPKSIRLLRPATASATPSGNLLLALLSAKILPAKLPVRATLHDIQLLPAAASRLSTSSRASERPITNRARGTDSPTHGSALL